MPRQTRRTSLLWWLATTAVAGVLLTGCGQQAIAVDDVATKSPATSSEGSASTGSPAPKSPSPAAKGKATPDPTPGSPSATPRTTPAPPKLPPRDPADPTSQQRTIQIGTAAPDPGDGRKVVIGYTLPSPCTPGLDHAQVDEYADRVVVTLHRQVELGERPFCVQMLVERSTTVALAEPLGGRPVVDGTTGKAVYG